MLGVDAGGTRTRALVAAPDGTRLGEGFSGGANPNSHGVDTAAPRLGEAVAAALDRAGPAARERLSCAVVGLAGVSALAEPSVHARMQTALEDAGAGAAAVFTADDEIAFASGTPEPDGAVLIAGTGAIATRIRDRTRTDVADGLGWLVGDSGSGFWIGHRAARASARQLSEGTETGPLTRAVLAHALPGSDGLAPRERARALARALTAAPPIGLAALAPLVVQAYEQGDAVARGIVDRAGVHLAASVRQVHGPDEGSPVVLAGGVLTGSGPVRAALVHALGAGTAVATAGCTAGAAAWTAAVRAGADAADRALHAAFTLRGDDER